YRIDEVNEAKALGQDIAACEGESDADAMWAIGIPATTSAHGAAATRDAKGNAIPYKPKWYLAHSEQLRGANLIVFNDNDEPGYAHADTVCKLSLGVANTVRRLDLKLDWPEIPLGGDPRAWLERSGGTPEKLKALMAAAPAYVDEPSNETGLAATTSAVQWRGWAKDGSPTRTMHNAMVAIQQVGVTCASDLFHNKILIGYHGEAAELQPVPGDGTAT